LISTGTNTSKDLLAGTYGTRANMAKKIKFLEENNLIERYVDVHDKRIFHFSLTQKAIEVLDKISPFYDDAIHALFSRTSETQIHNALVLLDTLFRNISAKRP